jgi:carbamoyl-phosphate synthase small subunit
MSETKSEAILILEDGTVFRGKAAGAKATSVGEICFNTGMTGYQEIFTDPSYYGQSIIMTSVHIGNYGTFSKENESASTKISGLICKNFSSHHSRSMADDDLHDYLFESGVVCIHDVDTRALVRHVREKGSMNCIISTESTDEVALRN